MKRVLVLLLLILTLLCSCATKVTKAPVEEEKDIVLDTNQEILESELLEEDLEAFVEPVYVEEIEELTEVVENEVEEVVLPIQEEPEVLESVSEDTVEEDFTDWSVSFTEKPQEEAIEEFLPIVETVSAVEQTTEPEEAIEPAVEEVVPAASSVVASEPVKELSGIGKVFSFILDQKLFCFGILTCLVGFAYLVIALIKTSDTNRNPGPRLDEEPVKLLPEKRTKTDDLPSDDDDAFLKSLLG